MSKVKNFIAFLLATAVLWTCAACGGAGGDSETPEPGGASAYIDSEVYNALDEAYRFDTDYISRNKNKFSGTLYMARAYGDELPGWKNVYEAYEKMYPNVQIKNAEFTSGTDMKTSLISQMSSGAETIGLVQGNYVQEQLKQYGYNFQGGFVETVNPYAGRAGEEVLVGDLIDDYTFNNLRSERITFQNTTTCFFVNTTALDEVGLKVSDIRTWDDIIDACRLLKAAGYDAPFGIGGNNDSLTSKDFKWMQRIYIDQYYMDLIDDIQVQPADYNYNKLTADGFEFSFDKNDYETDPNYKVNSMRAYNLLLNEDADNPYYVGAKSEKFRCFLNNLCKIGPYVSRGFATNGIAEIQQSFLRGDKNDAVFMVNYTGFGIALDNYAASGEIDFDWGCFDYVPMVCSCNVACNDASGAHTCTHVDDAATEDQCTLHVHTTKTRDEGGIGGFIGLYTEGKTAEEVELYLDFIRFFMSPYGQSLFYKGLAQNAGWPKALSAVTGAIMPASWSNFAEYSKNIAFNGLCGANWFVDFLGGCTKATGQQYSLCKTALQNNLPHSGIDAIVNVFNTQISLYSGDNLSQYAADCYKNYTVKPASK